MTRLLLTLCIVFFSSLLSAAEPARVMLMGTYHFADPATIKAVDLATPARQAQLQQVIDALAAFEPTVVGVERPAKTASEE